MDKNRVLRLLASVATTFMLTACGVSMKPDHPQVYDNFKERRPPKENVFVESGTLEQQPQQRASQFTPYSGPVYDGSNNQPKLDDASPLAPEAKEPVQLGTPSVRTIAPDGTTPTVPSQEQRSVWERLKNKFSLNTSIESKAVAERKAPIENSIMLAYNQDTYLAQGSTDGYSYYEAADEIIPDNAVPDIQSNTLLALNNASDSLVDVPEPQSYSDLKREGEKLDKQNLKDVPQKAKRKAEKPEKKAEKPEAKKPAPTAKKPTQAKRKLAALPDSITMADASDYVIHDQRAEIIYTNGQPVVTGFIGVIRGPAVN